MKLSLCSYWRSSSSWRVRLGLAHKGLDYQYVPVHLVREGGEQHTAEHVARNPLHQIPTLIVEDEATGQTHYVSQSVAILELLEELYPDHALLPADPLARARVRQLVEIINSGTQPLQNLSVIQHLRDDLGVDAKAFCARFIALGLKGYAATLGEHAGRFSEGDGVTMADLFLVPQLYNARRFNVDLEQFPRLLEIERQCFELPMFHASHPDSQPDADPDAPK